MIDLTVYGNGGFVLLKDVARRQDVSEKYLGHLAALLKNAGLIRAMRGAHGGVSLAKLASEITLKDIIAAVEGPILLSEGEQLVEHKEISGEDRFWEKATGSVVRALDTFTLDAIAAEQKNRAERIDYVI